MRNQSVTGFALHQRRYRERSHILHFFSAEFGRVDGVIRQIPPTLYHLATLQATGKSELKNFSQLDVQGQPFYLQKKALFAGFYLNEILLRLLPIEEPMPDTYVAYQVALQQLRALPEKDERDVQLKVILRQFESVFLQELGYAIDYFSDSLGREIRPEQYYLFIPQEGFVINVEPYGFYGQDLLHIGQTLLASNTETQQINAANAGLIAKLYRTIFTEILGNKPLKSRQLWVSQQQQG